MSFERGKFGIEYNPVKPDADRPWLLWAFALVFLAALVSLGVTVTRRICAPRAARPVAAPPAGREAAPPPAAKPKPVDLPPPPKLDVSEMDRRPVKVRNLLMKLEEAEKKRDVELAISTIEQIRALPGTPAADLDDKLARRLGALNIRRLFLLKSGQWVTDVVVKRGDSASRIARERGSTLASLQRLNDADVNRVFVGQTLKVLNHPRFNLVVHRRTRIADLSLNGKFFRRYYLTAPVTGEEGTYETPERLRPFLSERGIALAVADRAELEMLLPAETPVIISEL